MKLKEVLKKLFQTKYVPVLVAVLIGLVCSLIEHSAKGLLVYGLVAVMSAFSAGEPLRKFAYYGWIIIGAGLCSLAVMSVVLGLYGSALVDLMFAVYPASVIATRKLKE